MLDLTGIMFSSIMMLIAIVRAMILDRTLPWFGSEPPASRSRGSWKRNLDGRQPRAR